MAEGFDPRFNPQDQALFRGTGGPPADVAAEQARLDATDSLVLVYPLYWWSFPALLKGWIDLGADRQQFCENFHPTE